MRIQLALLAVLLTAAKCFAEIPEGRLRWMETLAGDQLLHIASKPALLMEVKGNKLRALPGDITSATQVPDGDLWLIRSQRVLRTTLPHLGGDKIPLDQTAHFQIESPPAWIWSSRHGDIFVDGARRFRTARGRFVARPLPPGDGWQVRPVADDSFGNIWGLAEDDDGNSTDICVLNREQPHRWHRLALPAKLFRSKPQHFCADDLGRVWWTVQGSLMQLDPQAKQGASPVRQHALKNGQAITAICRLPDREVVAGFADGSIAEFITSPTEGKWVPCVMAGPDPIRVVHYDHEGTLHYATGRELKSTKKLSASWHSRWREQPRMPVGNHDHVFARIGDRLYTAGGKTYHGWPASEWVNLDHLWSYHVRERTWRVESPMLEPGKSYSGIATFGGKIWLLGGYFRAGKRGTTATATVEIFDPSTGKLHRGPSLPEPRGQVIAFAIGQRLYAFGGASDEAPSAEVLSIGEGEDEWRVESKAPHPITQAAGCLLDGKVYIAGANPVPGLVVYDPSSRTWTHIKHPGKPTNAPLCAAHRGEVWLLGGVADGGKVDTHIYSPKNKKWRRGPSIPLPVAWAAAASVNKELIIAGGAYFEPRINRYYNTDRVFHLRSSADNIKAQR